MIRKQNKDKKYFLSTSYKLFKYSENIIANVQCNGCKYLLYTSDFNSFYILNNSIAIYISLFIEPSTYLNAIHELCDKYNFNYAKIVKHSKRFHAILINAGILVTKKSQKKILIKADNGLINDRFRKINTIQEDNKVSIFIVKDILNGDQFVMKQYNAPKSIVQAQKKSLNKIKDYSYIAQCTDYISQNNSLLFEYFEGIELCEFIKNETIKLEKKIILIKKIVKAISLFHLNGLINGDISFKNILVDNSYNLKVIDFETISKINKSKHIISSGNLFFIPPEKIDSNCLAKIKLIPNSTYSDVYQLGLVIYYIIYEKYPFEVTSWKNYAKLVISGIDIFNKKTPNGEEIPIKLIEIMQKAVSVKIENRYITAIQLNTELLINNF